MFYIKHDFIKVMEEIISDLECCWIKINLKRTKPLILGIVYFPKKKVDCLNQLRNDVSKLNAGSCETMIVGDFNFKFLDQSDGAKIDDFCCEFQLLNSACNEPNKSYSHIKYLY